MVENTTYVTHANLIKRLCESHNLSTELAGQISVQSRKKYNSCHSFHHELKDQLTGLTFCPSGGGGASDPANLNLTGLARAAVAGDEKALDLFSSWRPNMVEKLQASAENLNAYAGSASGVIYYLNENGSCMEVLQVGGRI